MLERPALKPPKEQQQREHGEFQHHAGDNDVEGLMMPREDDPLLVGTTGSDSEQPNEDHNTAIKIRYSTGSNTNVVLGVVAAFGWILAIGLAVIVLTMPNTRPESSFWTAPMSSSASSSIVEPQGTYTASSVTFDEQDQAQIDAQSLLSELMRDPVILKISMKTTHGNYQRMYLEGHQAETPDTPTIQWRKTPSKAGNFYYLEATPSAELQRDCPVRMNVTSVPTINVTANPPHISSCNLYDFRLVIWNNLTSQGATVHFHGLTPPSNEDGVPFTNNANIHAQNLQYYRFVELTYAGMHWMHAHTGFQEAYGVAAPIIFQHSDTYLKAIGIDKDQDVIAVLEEGFVFPKCAYSVYWYEQECGLEKNDTQTSLGLYINRQEAPIEYYPSAKAKKIRIRFLNAGSEAPWRITNEFSKAYGGVTPNMTIIATDGNDAYHRPASVLMSTAFVETEDLDYYFAADGTPRAKKQAHVNADGTVSDFELGIANRIDVTIELDPRYDVVITAVQMMHRADVTNPALRHIILHGANNSHPINATKLNRTGTGVSLMFDNFGVLDSLEAVHPLGDKTVTRNITVMNRGGDQFGGFPLSIYNGLHMNVSDMDGNLYPTPNYTALNHLKYQLPPYKVYRHNLTGETISTRRPCENCANGTMGSSGLRNISSVNSKMQLNSLGYGDEKEEEDNGSAGYTSSQGKCCWEWCNVPPSQCPYYELVDVYAYQPNEHYIPVCYGDRVRILFINSASYEVEEGHPMHLHGHNFALRELYNVTNGLLYKTKDFQDDGPLLDTIWVPWGTAVAFDFDAYNPGEFLFHCHNDFHLENGMMTTVRYMSGGEYGCDELTQTFHGNVNDYPEQLCAMTGCNATS